MAVYVDRRIKYCPKCVVQRYNGEKFCNLCGTELDPKPNSCPCGMPRNYYDKFCSYCGMQVAKDIRKVLEKLDRVDYSYGDAF
jgi:predicted amidophosphoribosyltransferase